jgi:hypothetical protein
MTVPTELIPEASLGLAHGPPGIHVSDGAVTGLSLRGSGLTSLPRSLADLPALDRLDLRWNRIVPRPDWLRALETRGCTVWE